MFDHARMLDLIERTPRRRPVSVRSAALRPTSATTTAASGSNARRRRSTSPSGLIARLGAALLPHPRRLHRRPARGHRRLTCRGCAGPARSVPSHPMTIAAAPGRSGARRGGRRARRRPRRPRATRTLAAQVDRANELYHAQDAPEITDAEYDQLFRELVALETAYPGR